MPRLTGKAKTLPTSGSKSPVSAKQPKEKAKRFDIRPQLIHDAVDSRAIDAALDTAGVGIWHWNMRNNGVKWSCNIHRVFGFGRKKFDETFDSYFNLIHEEDRSKTLEVIDQAIKSASSFTIDHRIIRIDGTLRWLECTGTVTKRHRGKAIAMSGTVRDITDRKRVELEKNDWKVRMEAIASSARLVVYDYDIITGLLDMGGTMQEVLGYETNDLRTIEQWEDLIHKEDRQVVLLQLKHAAEVMQPFDVCYRFRKKNGKYLFMHDRGIFLAGPDGHAARMLGIMNDVSDRVASAKVLEESVNLRKSIESAMPGMLYVFDIDKNINLYTNRDFFTYLGYPYSDDWQSFFKSVCHPDDIDKFPSWRNEPDGMVKECEYRMRASDGTWHWFLSRDTPFKRNKLGRITQIVGITQDITLRKQAQIRMNASEQSYRELFDSVFESICLQRPNGSYIDINKSTVLMFGYEKSELVGRTPGFLSPKGKNDLQVLREKIKRAAEGVPQEFEFWVQKKNGEIILTEVKLTQGHYFGEDIIISTSRDITARKRAKEALQQSEQSYRELFNTIGPVYIQDQDGTFIDVNQSACEMYGYTKDELVGKHPSFLSAPDKNCLEALERSTTDAWDGISCSFEWWGQRKDGQLILKEVTLKKGKYFDRDVIIACSRDVTQRRQAEEALRESELRFRVLQEASFGGIALHDAGRIIDCNQGLCDLTGYSIEELIGSDGLNLIAPEERDFVRSQIRSGYDRPYDSKGLRKDGSIYFLEIHGKNIPHKGKTVRVTEFRDITNRKQAEEKIVEQNNKLVLLTEDLKRKNEQLEDFTQIVSHNLRSPVGNTLTLLQFFESAASDAERKEYFDLMKQSSATTLNMLNDLNEVLKIKQNKNIERQHLLFERILEQTKAMLTAKITLLSAEITSDFANAPEIHYPSIYLESILLNLLDNALKYSEPQRSPRIHLKTSINENGHTILSVLDNGLGINLERYGHQVFKLRKTFHRHPESRGIGLFLVKNQVEAMSGEITVISTEGEGTTFLINFNKYLVHEP